MADSCQIQLYFHSKILKICVPLYNLFQYVVHTGLEPRIHYYLILCKRQSAHHNGDSSHLQLYFYIWTDKVIKRSSTIRPLVL